MDGVCAILMYADHLTHLGYRFFEHDNDEEQSFTKEFNKSCSLSYKTRLWGCAICFVLGYVIMFMSLLTVPGMGKHPEKFAILYSLGNIIALVSTCFLWGPWAQIKNMFAKIRVVATVIYLVCIAVTIVLAIKVKKVVPILLMIIIQCFAGIWYNLSYIPVRLVEIHPAL